MLQSIRFTVAVMVTVFTLCPFSAFAQQEGPSGSGGGDDAAIALEHAFTAAMANMQKYFPALYQELTAAGVGSDKNTLVMTVDQPLIEERDGIQQDSVSSNYPERNLILVNRARWNAISDGRVKEGLALHEYASLKRLENTGLYTYSSQYLAKFGLSIDAFTKSDLLNLRIEKEIPRVAKAFNYENGFVFHDPDVCIKDIDNFRTPGALVDAYQKLNYGDIRGFNTAQFSDWMHTDCSCSYNAAPPGLLWQNGVWFPQQTAWTTDGVSLRCVARAIVFAEDFHRQHPLK
jgi:hypothetical protein